jgi:hypothetical protein
MYYIDRRPMIVMPSRDETLVFSHEPWGSEYALLYAADSEADLGADDLERSQAIALVVQIFKKSAESVPGNGSVLLFPGQGTECPCRQTHLTAGILRPGGCGGG